MTTLNRNNILRWVGSFRTPPATVTAVDDNPILFPVDATSIDVNPLTNDTATYGLNTYSFTITGATTTFTRAPYWNGVDTLTIYPPTDILVGSFQIFYTISDVVGNVSNVAIITVNIPVVPTQWIGYAASASCAIDSLGQRTGYLVWGQLVLVNAITLDPMIPLTLKDNTTYDPNYVAPELDTITCPATSGLYCPLNISNFTNRDGVNYINIYSVVMIDIVGPTTYTFPTTILPGQSKQFTVPVAEYSHIYINYTTVGDPELTGYYNWYFSAGGAPPTLITTLLNTGPFDAGSTTLTYPSGATLYVA